MANGVSRAVIEVLLDRVDQGAATLSPAGNLTYANQRLATMLGKQRVQLVALLTFAPLGHGQTSCLVTDLAQALPPAQLAQEVRSLLGAMRSSDHHALEAIGRRFLELISAKQ